MKLGLNKTSDELIPNIKFSNDNSELVDYTHELSSKINYEKLTDEFRVFNNDLPKNTLLYLLQTYGEYETKAILRINKEHFDLNIPLLKSQIFYEVKNRDLRFPLDFLLKRHNYINILKKEELIISFLVSYSKAAMVSPKQFRTELIKLLGLKYYLKIGL
jgi:hypothetical protein